MQAIAPLHPLSTGSRRDGQLSRRHATQSAPPGGKNRPTQASWGEPPTPLLPTPLESPPERPLGPGPPVQPRAAARTAARIAGSTRRMGTPLPTPPGRRAPPDGAIAKTFGAVAKIEATRRYDPRRVIPAAGLDELLASPKGRTLAGPVSLSFVVDPCLVGVSVWGRPSAEQILALVRTHEAMRPVLATRTAALVDVRHLEWPDPAAFTAMVGYLAERSAWLAEYIERLALVRAARGPVGAVGAGFFDVSTRPFTVETFTGLREALAWIGRGDADALADDLEAALADASGTPALLRRLRDRLDASPGALSLAEAARVLGVAERTLQRLLRSWSTTFQAEQNRAQVRAAQRLLRETDASLTQIASAVGCGSLAQFSTMFRRVTGVTPSAWRGRA